MCNPVFSRRQSFCFCNINIFDIITFFYTNCVELRSTCLLMLCTKLIYVWFVFNVRMPTKVKLTSIYTFRYSPMRHIYFSSSSLNINILYFSCTGHNKSRTTCSTPLIGELIYVWLFCCIRMPTKVKLSLVYVSRYLPIFKLSTYYFCF